MFKRQKINILAALESLYYIYIITVAVFLVLRPFIPNTDSP